MSHHRYDPALQAELDHRRTTLQHDAERHQLAQLAGTAARGVATRIVRSARHARAGSDRRS